MKTPAVMFWCVLASSLSDAASWPGFRGPPAADVAATALPLTWSPAEHMRWTAALPGSGQSSPVIWGDHVYVTSVEGPQKERCHVAAFDLATGAPRWQGTVANAFPQESSNYISKAAPTAVVDALGVIAFFEGGNLLALAHDGARRWERNLVAEFGPVPTRHGLGSSLVQNDDLAFVWIERSEDPYLLAIEKRTGETRWKVAGLGAASWSTPVLLPAEGGGQLVLGGTGLLRGISPATGETLWTLAGLVGNATPSPCVVGANRLLLGATDGRGDAGGGKPSDSNCLVEIQRTATGWAPQVLWRAQRATCSFGSPIAHQGLAYFVNRTGILFCLDLETGEEVYAERTPESCWATPLAIGERIYLVGQKGTTTVVKAGRQFEVLAKNRLWESAASAGANQEPGSGEIQYAVAATAGNLLIRTGERLYCAGETP